MNLPNGHLLQNGKYRLTHVVGQGGFGITYKGVWFTEVKGALGTIKTEVPICVKEYFFKDYCFRDSDTFEVKVHSETGKTLFEKFKEKLIKEAKILSDVHHAHIVNVLEVFEENNTAYIVMEYISGNSLKYWMDKEGILSESKVLRYVHQIGKALQFVHEKSILHLDIKPSNILIDQNGKARLIDFGVSKRYDIEQQETSTTMLTLSKGFASIEQYDNEGTQLFSPCPDIYSLGATMYNLLTGKIPTESILRATRPLPTPRELNPHISEKTEAAIIKAMEIVPTDRFQSMTEMLAALDYPEEIEEKTDRMNVSSPEYLEEDDMTILYTTWLSRTKKDDQEETVLNTVDSTEKPKESDKPKKKNKMAYISLIVFLFICIGAVATWLIKPDKSVPPVVDQIDFPTSDVSNHVVEETPAVVEEPVPEPVPTETVRQPEEKPKQQETVKEEVKTTEVISAPVETTPSVDERNAEFDALIASGKEQMKAAESAKEVADYSKAVGEIAEAGASFTKAAKIKMTDELLTLIERRKIQEEDILSLERKAQYEEIRSFGNLTIVLKKETQKYGAIDEDARERISCKYLAVYRTQQGYGAFVRDDDMFDIYNTEGVMISERIPDYY